MVSGEVPPNSRSGTPAPDPDGIHTVAELAAALNMLRGAHSYTDLDKAVGGQPKSARGRHPQRILSPSTLGGLLSGRSVPTTQTMGNFLRACGLGEGEHEPWMRARERVSTAHTRRPAGAVRVSQADPRRLGVHACIQVQAGAEDLPAYVPRDVDADLRTAVTASRERGGFVLVKGSSSVGKSRTLYEAVKAALPEWWLLHPRDAAALMEIAAQPTPRTVIWLDEFQRYLNHPGGLPAGDVRALLDAGVVLVATLWPEEYGRRTALRQPDEPDPYDNDRKLLDLATVIDIPESFSRRERERAAELASDGRIRVALDTTDAGFTQVLAAGPELIRWWEHADTGDPRQCYGKAVITAALDARRIGATSPLTAAFLRTTAPAYLTPQQQATATTTWFDQAMDYATKRLHGATACLTPIAAGMGQIAGWSTADYLHQHARRQRRTEAVPGQAWQALIDHHDPRDTLDIADNARRRGHTHHAIALCKTTADGHITRQLAKLLRAHGHIDELRRHAHAGDRDAAIQLTDLLHELGQIDELRQRADAGNSDAAFHLVDLLHERGLIDELRQRSDAGHGYATVQLANLLQDRGQIDEAIATLWKRAGAAAVQLVNLLHGRGQIDDLHQLTDASWKDDTPSRWTS